MTAPATTPADGELLPCPMCGSSAFRWVESTWNPDAEHVSCSNCPANTGPCRTKEEAAEAWNTRTAPSPGKAASCYVCGQPAMYCASKHHEASPGKAEAERDADKWRLDSEDLEALHMCLDRAEVPRHTNFGVVYSAWGRVLKYASLQPEMPTTQPEESDRLFVLLCEIRAAAGDNGERMQSELVPFIAGLARDAERLTWLIDRGLELIACECEVGPPRMWTLGGMSQSLGWFASAREAIDAAIQQGRGTQ